MTKGITLDSGAADNVMPRRLLRGKSKVRASEASRQGVHYVAANGARIPNEGEADFLFRTREGQPFSWLFQVAEVNKILASVSALVATGHRVVFERLPLPLVKRTFHKLPPHLRQNQPFRDASQNSSPG